MRGIDFEIGAGEVFGLLGPNGAGKTTTVEILEGYRDRDAGEVEVLGQDPQRADSRWRERVGVVLQSSSLYPNLTAREHLALFAGYYERPRDVDEVVEIVGLTEKADARVRTLSGGQKRRLDLGLALVGNPELIFLDEPTTGFDPGARRAAWETIRNLRSLGTTILLTTHYLDEAEQLADRVAVLRDGEIVREGSPAELTGAGSAETEIRYRQNGHEVVERTTDPTRRLNELTGEALARGEELEGLEVRRPTLEEVYLELTGRMRLFLHELRAAQTPLLAQPRGRDLHLPPAGVFFLIFGSVYGNDTITKEHIRGAAFLEAGMIGYGVAATCFAGLGITMVVRRESGVLKRIRATPLPGPTYLIAVLDLDVPRLPDRGGADRRDRAAALLGRVPGAVVLAGRAAPARRDRVRGAGARRHEPRPLRRGLVGGDQRDLPPDGDHRRHVLHARSRTRASCSRSPRSCRSPTTRAHARRDGAEPAPLVGLGLDRGRRVLGRDRARGRDPRLPLAAALGLAERRTGSRAAAAGRGSAATSVPSTSARSGQRDLRAARRGRTRAAPPTR